MNQPISKPAPWMPTYNKQDAAVATVMFFLLLIALFTATLVVDAKSQDQPTQPVNGMQTHHYQGLTFSTPESWAGTSESVHPDLAPALQLADPDAAGFSVSWIHLTVPPETDPAQLLQPMAQKLFGLPESEPFQLDQTHQPPVGDDRLRAAITPQLWLTNANGDAIQSFFGLICAEDGRAWAFTMRHALPRSTRVSPRQLSNHVAAFTLITSAQLAEPPATKAQIKEQTPISNATPQNRKLNQTTAPVNAAPITVNQAPSLIPNPARP